MVALLYPVLLDRYYKFIRVPSGLHLLCVIILSCIVVWKHWPNIQRLLNKTESKISFKKKSAIKENPNEESRGDND
jgi:glycerol-3-phosphate acyltransferase PlsY